MLLYRHSCADRGTWSCWYMRRYRFCNRARVPSRDRAEGDSWSHRHAATMGHHLGNIHTVLHPVRRIEDRPRLQQPRSIYSRLSHTVGRAGAPSSYPLLRPLLPTEHSSMACLAGPLGGSDHGACEPPRKGRYQSSEGTGRVSRNRGSITL